jgi:hypothetical protein
MASSPRGCGDRIGKPMSPIGILATCRAARTKAAFNQEADIGAPRLPGLIYEFTAWSGAVKFSVSDITREILADRRRDADSETCRQQPASTILTAASP